MLWVFGSCRFAYPITFVVDRFNIGMGSRDSSGGFGLDNGGAVFRSVAGARGLFLIHSVQTSSGANASSISMRTGSTLPGVKRPRRETDKCYLVSLLRIIGAVSPFLHITLWLDQSNFNFILYFS